MAFHDRLLRKLDELPFLGFKVWDFSFRSLSHPYGQTFLKEIILRHPWHTLTGLLAYSLSNPRKQQRGDVTYLIKGTVEDFGRRAVQGDFLVALGFCQKPVKTADGPGECPTGRFNHDCLYLAGLREKEESLPSVCRAVCRECTIRLIGTAALQAGACFHIMTSALDIVHDIFSPALKQRRFRRAILCVCPYSVQPIIVPLLICRIEALVVQYHHGDCADYSQWSLADQGIKPERTFLSREGLTALLDTLAVVATSRARQGLPPPHYFKKAGHIYVPCSVEA